MWHLLAVLLLDSAAVHRVAVTPVETLTVTVQGTGSPIVLIPGLFGSAFGFRHLLGPLAAAGHRVIVIEPLAMGTSGRPSRADYSLGAQSRRVAAVLDSLGVSGAVIAGHSLGGAIALRIAWQRPDLVRTLVLIEAGPSEEAATPGFRRAMESAPLIRLIGGAGLVRRAVRRGLVNASGDAAWVTDDVIRAYTAGASADLGATLRAYVRMGQAREPESLAPHLAEVRCNVLLLLGAAPHSAGPSDAEIARLAHGLASLTVERVPGAGHYLHEEMPDVVVRTLVGI